jgi:hypothetical protein
MVNKHPEADWYVMLPHNEEDQDEVELFIPSLAYREIPIVVNIVPLDEREDLLQDAHNETWSTTQFSLTMANCGGFVLHEVDC